MADSLNRVAGYRAAATRDVRAVAPGFRWTAWALALLPLALSACAPALDWRQMQVADGRLGVAMPCRPAQQERVVPLAGQTVRWQVSACSVGGLTFGVGGADLADPARVPAALVALAQAAQGNLKGRVIRSEPAGVGGMTPHDAARQLVLEGRGADGQPAQMRVWVFAHGMRVFQASVLGPSLQEAHWRPFAHGLGIRTQ